jgi:hypothetical protein
MHRADFKFDFLTVAGGNSARRSFLVLPLSFLLLVIFCGNANAAQRRDGRRLTFSSVEPSSSFAIADFDGDHRLDLATVQAGQGFSGTSSYWIELQLSSVGREYIHVLAPAGGLTIEARDVNGDHAVDLVLTASLSKRPVAILLNDGRGNFSRAENAAFPEAFERSNNSVDSTSNRRAPAVAIPPQSRNGISPEVSGLPYDPSFRNSTSSSRPGFALSPFLLSQAGRAPPA